MWRISPATFFTPGVFSLKSSNSQATEIDTTFNNNKQKLAEFSIYGEDDWQLSSKLKINAGVHASAFKAQTQWYSSIQPRIGLRYLLPQDVALKVSYTHMNQYVHLLSSNSTSLPTDLWVPSTDKVKPMLSRQISLGFAKAIFDNKIDISIESYYKKMNGVIEYKEGTSYLNSSTSAWDTKVEAGKGKSYGIEFLVQKNTGKLKGWIGYTLSHSKRIFPTINYGKEFDYKYDRRHDFEVAAVYVLNTHWEVSGSWQFQTGNPFTVPIANYESMQETSPYNNPYINNQPIQYIQGRNQFRLLNYHRLDFGITWKKKKRRYEKSWNFSLYNAYNQQNPFFYTLQRYNESNSKKAVLLGTSILPILPSISYGIKF
ncbi:MAG: TonB-dependent receptor [Chitinophagaceae bacterium]|nr:TonB-dependent receptor [Chitinophagaceae bacterium]